MAFKVVIEHNVEACFMCPFFEPGWTECDETSYDEHGGGCSKLNVEIDDVRDIEILPDCPLNKE